MFLKKHNSNVKFNAISIFNQHFQRLCQIVNYFDNLNLRWIYDGQR